jgi:hypothetical protein
MMGLVELQNVRTKKKRLKIKTKNNGFLAFFSKIFKNNGKANCSGARCSALVLFFCCQQERVLLLFSLLLLLSILSLFMYFLRNIFVCEQHNRKSVILQTFSSILFILSSIV